MHDQDWVEDLAKEFEFVKAHKNQDSIPLKIHVIDFALDVFHVNNHKCKKE